MPEVFVCDSPVTASKKYLAIATPGHLVCVTGSFFLAAEMRSIIAASDSIRSGEHPPELV
ncbi:MAG: hypothetical protein HYV60_05440 [Planctomycetia bacterium]|nr:hypothetical protein [Planctomycetia bacterium]